MKNIVSLLFCLFVFLCLLRVFLAMLVEFFRSLVDPATWEVAASNPVKPVTKPRSAHQLTHL